MFGLFKRSDGFEWKEYVRTTVRLKRDQRKQQVVAAKDAVARGVREAGVASVSAGGTLVRKTGQALLATVRGAVWLVVAAFRGIGRLLTVVGAFVGEVAGLAGRLAGPPLRAIEVFLGQRPARLAAALGTVVALAWGLSRYRVGGFDAETTVVLSLAAMLAVSAALPALLPHLKAASHLIGRWVSPVVVRLGLGRPIVRGAAVAFGALAGVAVLVSNFLGGRDGRMIAALPQLPALGFLGTPEVSGRALAVTGDTIRLDGRLYVLAGIEAPEKGQSCLKGGNRSWRCGMASAEALGQRMRREVIVCKLTGSEDRGRPIARCRAGEQDLAAAQLKDGWAFSNGFFLSQYAGLEAEARKQKTGIWAGEAERPQVWRARLFEEAKRKAPNNCPVKGVQAATGPRYVMPWEDDYQRIKVRTPRGERWFCNEQDAQAAGYRLAI